MRCTFNGSGSSDQDGSIAQYSWLFGTGEGGGTGSPVTHDFKAAGTYSVTLRVVDDDGAVSPPLTKSVTVTAS